MLDSLFPENVIIELAAPWMWRAELTREEEAMVANAVDKRRREFTAGRTCARHILGRIGFEPDLTIGKDRYGAPVWPAGVVGSISHTDSVCVVSISRQTPGLTSLGVDVEKDTGLYPDLLDLVCDDLEKEACSNDRTIDPYRLAKLIFSAKESVYKCLYPITRAMLDFQDIHIQLDVPGQAFRGGTRGSLCNGPAGGVCEGRFLHAGGYIYTSCILSYAAKDTA